MYEINKKKGKRKHFEMRLRLTMFLKTTFLSVVINTKTFLLISQRDRKKEKDVEKKRENLSLVVIITQQFFGRRGWGKKEDR